MAKSILEQNGISDEVVGLVSRLVDAIPHPEQRIAMGEVALTMLGAAAGGVPVLAHPVLMLFLGGFFLANGAARFRLDRIMARVLLRPFGDSPKMILPR